MGGGLIGFIIVWLVVVVVEGLVMWGFGFVVWCVLV